MIYDDVPRENSDSNTGLSLLSLLFMFTLNATLPNSGSVTPPNMGLISKPRHLRTYAPLPVLLSLGADPDEMIYDDVELGEEGGGGNSSLDNGWSSSEFESYDEASDGDGRPENGMPHAFMRGKPPQRKTHVCTTSRPQLARIAQLQ